MANPLPQEDEYYQRIKKEGLKIHPLIWEALYQRIGDALSVINLIVGYYLGNKESIPVKIANRILEFTQRIKLTMNAVVYSPGEKDKKLYERLRRKKIKLHPLLKELITHHISNDTFAINVIVGNYTDPLYNKPIPLKDAKKLLAHTQNIKQLMDKLKETAYQE